MSTVNKKINPNYLNLCILLCVVFFLAYSIYSIFFGHIAMEEAAYTYAAKLVSEGKMPYTDFFYPQAPLLPYLYAPFQFILDDFLITSRFVSFFFSILIFTLIYKIAKKRGNGLAALLALALFVSSVFTLTRYTSVLVYTAASFFIILSIFFASKKLTCQNIFLSLLIMAAAMAVRVSILPAFIILAIYLLLKVENRKKFIFTALVALFSIIVFFLPFAVRSFDCLYFDVITYQVNTTKYYTIFQDISSLRWNLRKSLLLAGIVENFFSVVITGGALIIYYLWLLIGEVLNVKKNLSCLSIIYLYKKCKGFISKNHFELLLVFIILALFGAHLFLPDRPYAVYFTILVPLVAVLFGLKASHFFGKIKSPQIKRGLGALFAIIVILSPLLVSERTILNVNPFKTVKEASTFIQKNTQPEDKVLTLSVLPALSANRELLPHTERGNYMYFPRLDKETVQKYGLLDAETLISYINKKEPGAIALTSRYFFQKRVMDAKPEYQEIKKILNENYFQALKIENYAGNWGRLYIYLPRNNK